QQEHSKTELNPQATGSDPTGAGPSGSNNENESSIIDLGPQENNNIPAQPTEKPAPEPAQENKAPAEEPAPEPAEENKAPAEEPAKESP
ncbi:MAG: hypothetical protein VX588_11510, partial [Verrucomicrobiota bacterium]|nr:hypothetical protein [Verrucomicrobiota bacterium]